VKLALFDLDNTLIPFDSDQAWGDFVCELGWVNAETHRARNAEFYADYKAGTLDIYAYLDFALAPLAAHSQAELAAAHARFMADIVMPQMHSAAQDLVNQHRARGHECVIVTATNEFVTRPIAAQFGISELLGVRLEQRGGRYTGKPEGVLSFKEGKVARVQAWCQERGVAFEACESWFYSDSINDLALLQAATHAIATNPDARLLQAAQDHGFKTLHLW
jgi:HAD superfamily hydrolase (TIGR01490 family)